MSALCRGTPPEERIALYRPVVQQMDNALTKPSAAANIAQLARQAEETYSQTAPDVMVNIYYSAVVILQMKLANDPESRPAIYELKTRQRQFLDAVPLPERLWRLSAQPLPLNMEFSIKTRPNGDPTTVTELEYLLRNWQQMRDELERTEKVDMTIPRGRPWPPPSAARAFTNAVGERIIQVIDEGTGPEFVSDPVEREQFKRALAQYAEDQQQRADRLDLIARSRSFTNAVTRQVAAEYAMAPHLVGKLQEIMDGYLPPETSTNVMNKVFEAMKPAVAAKTPRPVPGAKGERWIRAAAPPSGPIVPAVARPSKIRDGFNSRPNQGAVAPGSSEAATTGAESPGGGAGSSGGRPVWPWALLGLAALAGGWVWMRTRG